MFLLSFLKEDSYKICSSKEKGNETVLFERGKENIWQMKDAFISPEDQEEGLRLQIKSEFPETVQKIVMERNGEISVIEKRS